jgi:hypothetical protein
MSRDEHSCTHWLRPRNSTLPRIRTRITRVLLVSQDRRHLYVTPWFLRSVNLATKYTVQNKVFNIWSASPSLIHTLTKPSSSNFEIFFRFGLFPLVRVWVHSRCIYNELFATVIYNVQI